MFSLYDREAESEESNMQAHIQSVESGKVNSIK
jgi:hypothetical protein